MNLKNFVGDRLQRLTTAPKSSAGAAAVQSAAAATRNRLEQAHMSVEPLRPESLHRRCDPSLLAFRTTDELPDLSELPGQGRAIEAARFGIGIKRPGYNLFVLGEPGTGKHVMMREFLARAAASTPPPLDLCYINNFADPQRPIALRLPAGTAVKLRADMQELIRDLQATISALFESEDYHNRRRVIDDEFKSRQEAAFEKLQERGKAKNLVLVRTPGGFAVAPVREGTVIGPDDFEKLPEAEQRQIQADMEQLQSELEQTIRQLPLWGKEHRDRVHQLNREVTMLAVGHVIDELRAKYRELRMSRDYFDAVERDIVDHADVFRAAATEPHSAAGDTAPSRLSDGNRLRRVSGQRHR